MTITGASGVSAASAPLTVPPPPMLATPTESTAAASPATPSQGKLRVINQGIMNSAENIQTNEDTSSECSGLVTSGNTVGGECELGGTSKPHMSVSAENASSQVIFLRNNVANLSI